MAPVQALDVTGCHEESELEQEEQNIVSRQQGRKQNNSYNPAPAPAPPLSVKLGNNNQAGVGQGPTPLSGN